MNNRLGIQDIEKCCGCGACVFMCPTGAICYVESAEGFSYPQINSKTCISCGLCRKVCPIINPHIQLFEQKAYAVKHKDKERLLSSTSGGFFIAVAEYVISHNGVVSGCVFNDKNMPVHVLADTMEAVKKMQGSKYVQSEIGLTFVEIRKRLEENTLTLFTGTPCQVAGLKNFLGREYENLLCVDIICHGVPSPRMFQSYLEWYEKRKGGKVIQYQFRSKKKNQWSYTIRTKLKRKRKVFEYEFSASIDPYSYAFSKGYTLRESCYQCPYSQIKRSGDITIGDFWGIQKEYPGFFHPDGVSALILNSNKGRRYFEVICNELEILEVTLESIIAHNTNLNYPTERPQIRDMIYKVMNTDGFSEVKKKYLKIDGYHVAKIKDIIPWKIKKLVERFRK